ncbi:hypothetical protein BJ166DRAFT_15459 [Pestalotiopsis sp. NC0098]|nr:hypothetical protein BJ166DRAFT_15459 [Pestalotiopsis sp. NC0098]
MRGEYMTPCLTQQVWQEITANFGTDFIAQPDYPMPSSSSSVSPHSHDNPYVAGSADDILWSDYNISQIFNPLSGTEDAGVEQTNAILKRYSTNSPNTAESTSATSPGDQSSDSATPGTQSGSERGVAIDPVPLVKCSHCRWAHWDRRRVQLHERSRHSFRCPHSDCAVKSFSSRRSLQRHLETIHVHENDQHRRYFCRCGSSTNRKDHHMRHIKTCNKL